MPKQAHSNPAFHNKLLDFFRPKNLTVFKITVLLLLSFTLFNINTLFQFISHTEKKLIDFRYTTFQSSLPNTDIIIIDIDASSINKLSHWPWSRIYYAKAIEKLQSYGAKVIGFDILFDNDSLIHSDDIVLSNTLKDYQNIILASRKYTQKNENYELETWSKPIKLFADHSDYGFVNYPFDPDGSIRRAYPFLKNKNSQHISFDLHVLSQYLEIELSAFTKSANEDIIYSPSKIPLFSDSSFYINYTLCNDFIHYPFYLLLEDRIENPDQFKDKIILIGATDPALNDILFTPIGHIPGVTVHAYSILTLLQGNAITTLPESLTTLLTLTILGLITFFCLKKSTKKSFYITLTLLATHSTAALYLFSAHSLLIPWASLLILGSAIYIIITINRLLKEEKEKKYVHHLFKQYVSPQVVQTLLKDPTAIKLGGEKKEVSIFFSDIRSFTSISEKNPPETIVLQLNEYLDAMTHCIFKWNGTLDKYVGDEIMAIWGAPVHHDHHALLSVACSWEQLALLKDLQKNWESEGRPVLDIGIGINTGHVIVGNIGSVLKKDYTVIGDPVNYAARLEAATRDFSDDGHVCRFIISHNTYAQVKEHCEVKPLGTIQVKGKEETYPIYEVLNVDLEAIRKLL